MVCLVATNVRNVKLNIFRSLLPEIEFGRLQLQELKIFGIANLEVLLVELSPIYV